ncbi:MAG: hypothetical protein WKG01_18560 [Kofleriaceae bacterium]
MIDRGPDDLRWELRQCLADPVPARQRLLALIRAVDLAHDSLRTGNADIEPLVQQVLARAAVTIAPLFTTASEPMDVGIAATAVAARAYLASPSEDRWSTFEQAATDSYPFGPGDGCLAIDELGGCGQPGAGDHGAGFIWEAAIVIGMERVCDALHSEIDGWLAEFASR